MKTLMKGNEAIAEAAILCGCHHFFGYPITPATEILECFARYLPKVGGVFLQAESEIAAINMVYGAAATGVRLMTASSGLGLRLKQEGISYLAGAELPCVIVNVMRGGPGLGSIQPAQSDYFQATKGGGHGDYHSIVLAPYSVNEAASMTMDAFYLSDKYRIPVIILIDGFLGQMMEPVTLNPEAKHYREPKPWSISGKGTYNKKIIKSYNLIAEEMEIHNHKLQLKYNHIKNFETSWDWYGEDDADIILVAYGISSRISKSAIDMAVKDGVKVSMFRPKTLGPFPSQMLYNSTLDAKKILVVEMSEGQMIEDVQLSVKDKDCIHFYGRSGGMIPKPEDIFAKIMELSK